MTISTKLLLVSAALAGAQGCTAPAASKAAAATAGSPLAEPPPPQPVFSSMPVLNRELQFRNGPGAFITEEDYPAAALHARQQGTVRFKLTVGPHGRVTGCTILQSSGSAALDSSTCALMQRRARFTPATDVIDNAVRSSIDEQYSWRLPAGR
jgi:protein TonB